MKDALDLLLPRPRALLKGDGRWSPPTTRPVDVRVVGTDDARILGALERGLAAAGLRAARRERGAAEIELRLDADEAPGPETYRLEIDGSGARAWSSSALGLFRAATTIAELVRIGAQLGAESGVEPRVPSCAIEDGPDLAERGFMLDVSRDRVPTMPELRALVERLARLKFNRLQLYTEHTFAYPEHAEVWRDASPLTAEEVDELCRLGAERHVAVVPNQQCLGHMHRWLTLPRYAPLAEVPEGIEHAFSVGREPFSLNATDPASLELVEGLLDALLPAFTASPSSDLNVGLDETFDLGEGGSREACEERGKGRVYLEYVHAIHERVRARGRRMQFWGDVILEHPELVPELPSEACALLWGYEAKHPFDSHAARFRRSGLTFQTCPGTSSWQCFGGRIENMRRNVKAGAQAALMNAAEGLLLCDWGDFGHWQPPIVSLPGLLEGASRAWNVKPSPGELEDLLVVHGPLPRPWARALLRLGALEEALATGSENGTALFFLLRYAHLPWPIPRCGALTADALERAATLVAEARAALDEPSAATADAALPAADRVRDDLAWVADVCGWAVDLGRARLAQGDGGQMSDVPAEVARDLRGRLADLVDRHRTNWLARSRPGGLEESVDRFERVAAQLPDA